MQVAMALIRLRKIGSRRSPRSRLELLDLDSVDALQSSSTASSCRNPWWSFSILGSPAPAPVLADSNVPSSAIAAIHPVAVASGYASLVQEGPPDCTASPEHNPLADPCSHFAGAAALRKTSLSPEPSSVSELRDSVEPFLRSDSWDKRIGEVSALDHACGRLALRQRVALMPETPSRRHNKIATHLFISNDSSAHHRPSPASVPHNVHVRLAGGAAGRTLGRYPKSR